MAITISSDIFKKKREELGLSLREVEAKTGVNRQTISNIEHGRNIPDGHNLVKLMVFYEISNTEVILAD